MRPDYPDSWFQAFQDGVLLARSEAYFEALKRGMGVSHLGLKLPVRGERGEWLGPEPRLDQGN